MEMAIEIATRFAKIVVCCVSGFLCGVPPWKKPLSKPCAPLLYAVPLALCGALDVAWCVVILQGDIIHCIMGTNKVNLAT